MKNVITHGWKSKTVLFNTLVVVAVPILVSFDWQAAGFSEKFATWATLAFTMTSGFVNIGLRSVNTKALEPKECAERF